MISHSDLDARLSTIVLTAGAHASREEGLCMMEAAAYLAGEPHSDSPGCVSPVIAAFGRRWNDGLPDDATRTRLLVPLLPLTIGTRTTDADEMVRSWLAMDWLVRVQTPAWLRLAGLKADAEALEACAPLRDSASASAAMPALKAARERGDAAGAAARAAAWDAARAAAGDAAGAAARDAAWAAARDAAWAAAWDAARDAAGDAARDAAGARLAPTVEALQVSAQDLMRRMCAVGRAEVAVAVAERSEAG